MYISSSGQAFSKSLNNNSMSNKTLISRWKILQNLRKSNSSKTNVIENSSILKDDSSITNLGVCSNKVPDTEPPNQKPKAPKTYRPLNRRPSIEIDYSGRHNRFQGIEQLDDTTRRQLEIDIIEPLNMDYLKYCMEVFNR